MSHSPINIFEYCVVEGGMGFTSSAKSLLLFMSILGTPVGASSEYSLQTELFSVTTPAFSYGQNIEKKYTSEGINVSPPLQIRGVPHATKELVLIVEDPDVSSAPPFVHWLVAGISPETFFLSEDVVSVVSKEKLIQGKNSWGNSQYQGPLPPKGEGPHRYFFRLYALGSRLDLQEGFELRDLEAAMKRHILSQTEVMGIYQR